MVPTAFVQFISHNPDESDGLAALERCDDIVVTVTSPDDLRADGGTAAVDCVVVDAETVVPERPGPAAGGDGDATAVLRCAADPPDDGDNSWVEVGTVAGRRTLVNRVRYTASAFEPTRVDSDTELVDGTNRPGYVLDSRGRFVAVNDAFVEVTEYERQALLGSHASLSLTETVDAEFDYGLPTKIRVNSAKGGTIECLRDAGVAVVSDAAGERTRTVGVLRPQTDQVLIERDPAVLKRAIDAAHTPLTLSDPTQADNPLVYVNDAFEQTTGYGPADVLGRNCRLLQGEKTDEAALAELRTAIDEERPVTVELRNYCADGTPFWNRLTVTPIYDERNELVHFLGSQEDITDRRAIETELREQRDGLELLNQVVRHDIRNDLQKIMLYLGEIIDREDGDTAEFAQRSKDMARHAAELTGSARDLTTAILDSTAETTPTPLRETLLTEVDSVRAGAGQQATVIVDGELPEVDVLAGDLLSAIFRNLLTNAIVHNDDTPEVRLSATAQRETVLVTVTDNGPGVADSRKAEIFEKGNSAGAGAGSGIGLDLVQTLVENYDGDVWVEDREGDRSGAVFKIRLNRV